MKTLIDAFEKKGLKLASVESFTGGLFASEITSIAGASKVFIGSLVTYDTQVKIKQLGVSKNLIESRGVISDTCAKEMARQGLNYFNCDVVVSFTGNAGPSVLENKEVGLWYGAIATKDKLVCFENHSLKSRNELRQEAVDIMLEHLKKEILG